MTQPQSATLETVDGIGPKLAQALRQRFGGDLPALAALRRADLDALAKVPGLSRRRAVELARRASASGAGDAFLATEAARRIRDEIVANVQAFAATGQGRDRLAVLPLLPDIATAAAAAQKVMAAKAEAARLDRPGVAAALRRMKPAVEPNPVRQLDMLIVCESEEIRVSLQDRGLDRWAELGGPEAMDQAHEAGLVVAVVEDGVPLPELDALVEVPASAPAHEVVPAMALAWFRANRATIAACAELARLTGNPSVAPAVLAAAAPVDGPRLDPNRLPALVAELRVEVDRRVREGCAALSLRGDEALQMLGSRLPPAVAAVITQACAWGHSELRRHGAPDVEAFQPGFPVGVDDEEVQRAVRAAEGLGRVQRFQQEVRAARTLVPLRDALQKEITAWLDFDLRFALGSFALHHDLQPALFGERLELAGSANLHLTGRPDAQTIDYRLGGDEPVAILTGANSGGKSTLLEHLAQLVVMARLGLPVKGKVTVPWFEELHVVAGRRALDAGALETFLRSFLPLASGEAGSPKRLILADEVEAMTEPTAAGRILAFFLERVAAGGSTCLLVSHMADAILANVGDTPIRVDGIEATGLDAQFRLVVDRRPRMGHHARSTPELIVQRIASTATGSTQQLFAALLERMDPGVGRPGRSRRAAPRANLATMGPAKATG